ncbi:CAMK/CAMK-Unique protein kinase [Coprinopsis cinerea okayama7|uniref:CAMK/CAMK-Unique protein kinase n=1 Tax=Coprinopsis cinerea (strain Okayama-7 / 130 / ATCC MYA-4618 / FGSC 9003) TaxID=240176 RepID=A8N6J1_COPC7|nr:CAMK/CAMK-Unique protein kinase [Coprinopsis cinerea okayama7\|eukprot:XP_001830447.2 CAMK/CAMK-Unique protein kinase [Coprinopsis cinerea okayama7\
MLQYPVQVPSLSLSSSAKLASKPSKDNIPYLLSNDPPRQPQPLSSLRFQKDPYAARPVGPNRLPAPIVPLSISTNLVPSPSASSPSTASAKHPRSPYISSRQLSASPVPFRQQPSGPAPPSALSQCASSGSYPIEDVLTPGDIVGEGLVLQNEVLRLVGSTNESDAAAPAKEFEVVRVLGTGSYAVVYLVREILSRPPPSEDGHMTTIGSMDMDGTPQLEYGREYAIKLLSKANLDEEALAAQMTEVTIHQSLPLHPNIVTLHRTLETPSFLLLLLEYVPGEDLFYFLEQARDHYEPQPSDFVMYNSRTPPTPSLLSNLHPSQLLSRTRLRLIASMFSQMCDAVAACHSTQVFHRDIKPENFIVTDGWVMLANGRQERKVIVKLTDFGLSTTDIDSSDVDCGSAPYMSYECRNNIAPTYRPRDADVWSLGIVLINMLYHFNPWTDTAEGACSSFDLYRRDPVNFFTNRFPGMTRGVAEFLASRVFCILEGDESEGRRISAADFGVWVKDNLVTMLAGHGMQRTLSTSSTQGHPITSIPVSHRPMSRNPSNATAARGTPAMPTRSLSRAPSLGPAYEREEKSELSTVIDQDNEDDVEVPEPSEPILGVEEAGSRSASTSKRRKRGARKGKGAQASSPTSPQDDTIVNLAAASECLARELSKQSKVSLPSSPKSTSTSSRKRQPLEPVSMYAMPTPLLNSSTPRTATKASTFVTCTPVPPSAPTKKPSRWKLSFGKANASTLANAVERPATEEAASPASAEPSQPPPPSTTVNNVTNLIMGLDAPAARPIPPAAGVFDDGASTWARGRRPRDASPVRKYGGRSPRRGLQSPSQPSLADSWVDPPSRGPSRAISPSSTRSGRPIRSSASSMASSNWRSSMSTTSSAGTSTSAFTHYSNGSTRSISTTATSVSATSWRTSVKQPSISSNSSGYSASGGYTSVPKNIKLMNGVPWELDQLPRGQHPDPSFGNPPPRKQRTRKHKDIKLDTITERPSNSAGLKSPELRKDAMTSTSDLPAVVNAARDEGDNVGSGGVKKVHKGQINALAKMLSALRR